MLSGYQKKLVGMVWSCIGVLVLSSCKTGVSSSKNLCSPLGACLGGTVDQVPPAPGDGQGTLSSPFFITVKTFWESDTGKTFPTSHPVKLIERVGGVYLNTGTAADLSQDTCQVRAGTTKASPTEDRNITCGVKIPRAQLFFSTLDLEINASKEADCDIVYYWPYGYLASSATNFTSRWQKTPLDCTATPTPVGCYSGPIVETPGFPDFSGLYFDIFDKTQAYTRTFSIPSANSKLRQDNRWTSYRPLGLPGGNIAGDWSWRCVQKGDSQTFSITLRIIPVRDEDPFLDSGDNHFGWLDDNGNDRGFTNQ